MEEFGIDINDMINGIGLPPNFHHGLHTNDYYNSINRASKKWNSERAIRNSLREIAKRLAEKSK